MTRPTLMSSPMCRWRFVSVFFGAVWCGFRNSYSQCFCLFSFRTVAAGRRNSEGLGIHQLHIQAIRGPDAKRYTDKKVIHMHTQAHTNRNTNTRCSPAVFMHS